MMAFIGTPDEIRDLFREDECARHETALREQMSGPCVHYGPHGCEIPREDGQCPHLDNARIVCPIKDVLGAACQQETLYKAIEPEFVEPEPDEDHSYAIRRPRFKAGDKVRILHPTYKGYTGTIRRYYAATENYLLSIDGTRDTIWLSEQYLEAA